MNDTPIDNSINELIADRFGKNWSMEEGKYPLLRIILEIIASKSSPCFLGLVSLPLRIDVYSSA